MTDHDILEEIKEWLRHRPPFDTHFETSHYFVETQASIDFEQWKRLSQRRMSPIEEGYSRMKVMRDAAEGIHRIISEEKTVCLTSNNKYLRKYAELVLSNENI